MTVAIIWSLTNSGTAITEVDHGGALNGADTVGVELFVRHDGVNEITDVGFYLAEFAGTYVGHATAAADLAEVLGWGDNSTEDGFGGWLLNFLATTVYPESGWPLYSSKSPGGGFVIRTGVGDSEANAITLPLTSGASIAGEILAGVSPNVRFKVKNRIPADVSVAGVRQFRFIMRYTYTS